MRPSGPYRKGEIPVVAEFIEAIPAAANQSALNEISFTFACQFVASQLAAMTGSTPSGH